MVAGHTKNVVDGAFGHVKMKLKTNDAHTPGEMMDIVANSSKNTIGVRGSDVKWRMWKLFLESFFKVPSGFHITKYHVFRFDFQTPGVFYVKEYSFSSKDKSFNMLKKNFDVETIRQTAHVIVEDPKFESIITPLSKVKSAQHNTRHGYLLHNIVNRYYAGDEKMKENFFDHCHRRH